MDADAIIALLVAAFGLLVIRIGWGLPGPTFGAGARLGSREGLGLLGTLLCFMLGIFLMAWGLAHADL